MPIRVAINGFGRIGRCAFKIALTYPDVEIIAINDLASPKVLAHLLKYDTVYGTYPKDILIEKNKLIVGDREVLVLSEKDPKALPWNKLDIDVVLECTGRFTKNGEALAHVQAGAKKVIISAPVKGDGGIQTFLFGVNDDAYLGQNVISNASCTTNCISPVIAVLHSKFKVLKSVMTTVHAVTAEQNLIDGPPPPLHEDMRRARAAGFNIVPTTTGAAKAAGEVIPELRGIFDGIAIRVPVMTGSISDITCLVSKKTTVEDVNEVFLEAKKDPRYKNVLDATYEPLVSSDIIGSIYSAVVDLSMTKVVDGDLIKVLAWYDNEWGYSARLIDMARAILG